MTPSNPIKTIAMDEEGYFVLPNSVRVTDESIGFDMLKSLKVNEFGVASINHDGEDIIVEAFDKPYIARQIHIENEKLIAQMPYQFRQEVVWSSLCLDEWDRIHGTTTSGVPTLLSRPAQAEFFNSATEFSDDSFQFGQREVKTPPYYFDSQQVNQEPFWSQKYQENPSPPWNLDQPHPELTSLLQQLKINKMRILVPGCGYGHDAAFLAEKGHLVTGIDISPEAIEQAKSLYGHISGLNFIEADVFNLNEDHQQNYDLIFEHTCYCAISPNKRSPLIKKWKQYLAETGHILGVFFVVPKREGPYFGGSEWELREKLEKDFQFLYWTRLKHSPGWRKGAELLVYAQIKESQF